ncbi:MAG: regulatory protein GemA [Pseudomonadota bacterium]
MANKYPTRFAERRKEIQLIHIAKAELGLDDETYRDMLFTVARVRSSAALDWQGRKAVLDHLKARGFKVRSAKQAGKPANPPAELAPMIARIEALLAEAQRPWAYANGMARRMFGVERLEWCSADQLHRIVAALMVDQRRRKERG